MTILHETSSGLVQPVYYRVQTWALLILIPPNWHAHQGTSSLPQLTDALPCWSFCARRSAFSLVSFCYSSKYLWCFHSKFLRFFRISGSLHLNHLMFLSVGVSPRMSASLFRHLCSPPCVSSGISLLPLVTTGPLFCSATPCCTVLLHSAAPRHCISDLLFFLHSSPWYPADLSLNLVLLLSSLSWCSCCDSSYCSFSGFKVDWWCEPLASMLSASFTRAGSGPRSSCLLCWSRPHASIPPLDETLFRCRSGDLQYLSSVPSFSFPPLCGFAPLLCFPFIFSQLSFRVAVPSNMSNCMAVFTHHFIRTSFFPFCGWNTTCGSNNLTSPVEGCTCHGACFLVFTPVCV